jgi:hypothetical protein
MHNESLKDRVVDGTVSDNGSTPSSKSPGLEAHIQLPTKYVFAGLALAVGIVVGKKFNARALTANTASKIQDVAEQAEEAANRG